MKIVRLPSSEIEFGEARALAIIQGFYMEYPDFCLLISERMCYRSSTGPLQPNTIGYSVDLGIQASGFSMG